MSSTEKTQTVLIVDDHSMVREGLAAIIHGEVDLAVNAMVGTAGEAAELLEREQFDIAIIDFHLPDYSGIELIRKVSSVYPDTRWILLTMHKHPAIREEAINAGAHAFVLKDSACDELIDAIRSHTETSKAINESSSFSLSSREKEVLHGIAKGMISKEIADQLGVSAKTVETYRERLMKKTGSRNLAELMKLTYDLGLL